MRTLESILVKNPNITKDLITELYYNKWYNIKEIQTLLNINQRDIKFLFITYGIKIRTSEENNNSKVKKVKTKQTLMANYGVDNPSKSSKIQDTKKDNYLVKYDGKHWNATETVFNKRKTTNQKRYGSEHVFQSDHFKEKNKETCLEVYGKEHHKIGDTASTYNLLSDTDKLLRNNKISKKITQNWDNLSDEVKAAKLKQLNSAEDKGIRRISKIEKRFESLLINENIAYTTQKWISNFAYDFRVTGTNILIEVQGDYWHCNPNKYSGEFIHPTRKILAKDIWVYDESKRHNAEKYGYKVIYVWESEIKAGLVSLAKLNLTNITTT